MARERTTKPRNQRDDTIDLDGVVSEVLPRGFFRVTTSEVGDVTCKLAGRMRINRITLVRGDAVDIEVSTHDVQKGRITFRRTPGRPVQAAQAA
ncbi:translation initiation factor IF-1 [Gluconobacter cerinus]|nr:translation initiation factor IF-1 [Komagataeibacter sp. FNDCR1]